MSKMVLYGVRYELHAVGIDQGFEKTEIRDAVATFDNEQLAKQYIKNSKLASYNRHRCNDAWNYKQYQFCDKSLLRNYSDTEIEEYIEPDLPHNPTLQH